MDHYYGTSGSIATLYPADSNSVPDFGVFPICKTDTRNLSPQFGLSLAAPENQGQLK